MTSPRGTLAITPDNVRAFSQDLAGVVQKLAPAIEKARAASEALRAEASKDTAGSNVLPAAQPMVTAITKKLDEYTAFIVSVQKASAADATGLDLIASTYESIDEAAAAKARSI